MTKQHGDSSSLGYSKELMASVTMRIVSLTPPPATGRVTMLATSTRCTKHGRLRPSKPSPPDGATVHINAPYSTFNNIAGHQYNVTHNHIYPSTSAVASSSHAPPSHVAPFNDAPIDQLSVHFTGQQKELALITKASKKRRRQNIPSRCILYGNQGVGKSQLTYKWANSTYLRQENSYILWISAMTVEKLYQGLSRLLCLVDHPDHSHPDQGVRLERCTSMA